MDQSYGRRSAEHTKSRMLVGGLKLTAALGSSVHPPGECAWAELALHSPLGPTPGRWGLASPGPGGVRHHWHVRVRHDVRAISRPARGLSPSQRCYDGWILPRLYPHSLPAVFTPLGCASLHLFATCSSDSSGFASLE
jgi:hypothetical protein